jgi:nitrite reductase/ring-hydroxylating ferredoxin subunit
VPPAVRAGRTDMAHTGVALTRQRVCTIDDLPQNAGRAFEVQGLKLVLFNIGGEIFAMNNRCPHRGGPLSYGEVTGEPVSSGNDHEISWTNGGGIVRCPWHRWEFDIRTGSTITSPAYHVVKRKTYVSDGWVYVDLSDRRASESDEDEK